MQALLAFKVRHSGFSSSWCRNPVLERLMWASDSLLLGENPVTVISSHLWITHPTVMGLHSTATPPLLPISFWFLLHIFSCGKHFLLAFMSFSQIFALIDSCNFSVPIAGSELRVFLLRSQPYTTPMLNFHYWF